MFMSAEGSNSPKRVHMWAGINSRSLIPPMRMGRKKRHWSLILARLEMLSPRHFRNLRLPHSPRPGLLQLALLPQEKGKVVHKSERLRMLGSQLGLKAFQGSPVQPFCLAAWSAKVSKHEKCPRSRGFTPCVHCGTQTHISISIP